jgi:hypothetical protein
MAIAAGGCGEDKQGGAKTTKEPVVRCTPAGSAKKVAFHPKFRAGQKRVISIAKTRRVSNRPKELRSTATAELRVLSGGPKRASMRWTAGEVVLPLVGGELPAEAMDELEAEAGRTVIEYDTDEFGDFGEVRNLADLRIQATGTVNALERIASGDAEVSELVRATRELVQSDSFIQTVLVEDVGLLHGIYGVELVLGKPQNGPSEVPNPFGGRAIPATVSLKLVTARDANGCAVAELVSDPDPKLLVDRLVEGARRFGGTLDRSQFASFKVQHRVRYTYDPGSGWVVRTEATKDVRAPGGTRLDRTVVTSR